MFSFTEDNLPFEGLPVFLVKLPSILKTIQSMSGLKINLRWEIRVPETVHMQLTPVEQS